MRRRRDPMRAPRRSLALILVTRLLRGDGDSPAIFRFASFYFRHGDRGGDADAHDNGGGDGVPWWRPTATAPDAPLLMVGRSGDLRCCGVGGRDVPDARRATDRPTKLRPPPVRSATRARTTAPREDPGGCVALECASSHRPRKAHLLFRRGLALSPPAR